MSLPISLKVKAITQDAPNLKTYVFEHNLRAKPGQFVMVWLPDVDEVPMCVGWQADKEFQIGIAKAGDCTTQIHKQIKVGDRLGIRGPFGSSFQYKNYKKIILVGGGYGTPSLLNLAQKTTAAGIDTTMIVGARSADYLLYEDKIKSLGCKLLISTDDGSKGHHGFCTEVLKDLLEAKEYDCIYTCGPEPMMVKVAELAEDYNTESQLSLERFMKCGFGICGQCCMDNSGIRICKEGPVLNGKLALDHHELGKYTRNASGKVEKF